MISDKLLKVVVSGMVPIIILFAIYVQMHGEITPGGGFQAGVLLAAAFIGYSLAFGRKPILRLFRLTTLIHYGAIGALIYLFVGLAPVLRGGNFLQHSHIIEGMPLLSQEIGIFILELGVGLTVFSSILALYLCFADLVSSKAIWKE
ncbi:Na+/H+ antiporter family protein [Neorickettsia helminthoeca str. Oregon]|uniref:Na+/H+ antiporter family protein n=1 Tax=Neorickettsia helminthoeca str. Oregon TaxID=1286528 RepID=X5HIZ2_9RICK|nr:Na(+)/H(+) antiporter subunit B [Neorickettsia helminthoeca]AHX11009.1 Na+/H+ antiporter family protein [Neorickettsia helminthoeca str. Oregon]